MFGYQQGLVWLLLPVKHHWRAVETKQMYQMTPLFLRGKDVNTELSIVRSRIVIEEGSVQNALYHSDPFFFSHSLLPSKLSLSAIWCFERESMVAGLSKCKAGGAVLVYPGQYNESIRITQDVAVIGIGNRRRVVVEGPG